MKIGGLINFKFFCEIIIVFINQTKNKEWEQNEKSQSFYFDRIAGGYCNNRYSGGYPAAGTQQCQRTRQIDNLCQQFETDRFRDAVVFRR